MSDDIRQNLEHLLTHADTLSAWERAFLKSAAGCPTISEPQIKVIQMIAARKSKMCARP